MTTDKRHDYTTRDAVMKLLSDAEVASVSTAETATKLAAGEEFLDLEHLDKGVLKAGGEAVPMGRVLPKKAVHEATWTKILAQLAAPRTGA